MNENLRVVLLNEIVFAIDEVRKKKVYYPIDETDDIGLVFDSSDSTTKEVSKIAKGFLLDMLGNPDYENIRRLKNRTGYEVNFIDKSEETNKWITGYIKTPDGIIIFG